MNVGVGKVASPWPVVPHLVADELRQTMWEGKQTMGAKVPGQVNKASNLRLKMPVRVSTAERTLSLTGEFLGETHRVLQHIHQVLT